MSAKHIVIVGGGFGGVAAARALAGAEDCLVTLIDRRNYYLFQPLLYQVAMAGLNPAEISVPLRKLFSKEKNISVVMAEIDHLDLAHRRVQFDDRWLEYDYLVLSCGSKHFYFGHDEWEEFAPGLKTIEQATEIRRRVLMAFENAEKEKDPRLRQLYLTFAVVGGGPTGVELAGAIAEMARTTLRADYRRSDLSKTRVLLIEGGPRVLPAFSSNLSQKSSDALKKLGVEIMTNALATCVDSEGLVVNARRIDAKTVVWAAGVKPSKLADEVPSAKDKSGRILVEKDLSLRDYPEVFVIGDQAAFIPRPRSDSRPDSTQPSALPGIAPVAMQEGAHAAKQILADLSGKTRREFIYFDKGMMATIGRSKAVVSFAGFEVSGFLAWITWVFVHIFYLMQFKNKIFVFLEWVWAYFSFGRGARLIVHKTWRFYSGEKIPIGKNQYGQKAAEQVEPPV